MRASLEEMDKAREGLRALGELLQWLLIVGIPVWLFLTLSRLAYDQTVGWAAFPLNLGAFFGVRKVIRVFRKKAGKKPVSEGVIDVTGKELIDDVVVSDDDVKKVFDELPPGGLR